MTLDKRKKERKKERIKSNFNIPMLSVLACDV